MVELIMLCRNYAVVRVAGLTIKELTGVFVKT